MDGLPVVRIWLKQAGLVIITFGSCLCRAFTASTRTFTTGTVAPRLWLVQTWPIPVGLRFPEP